MVFPASVSLWVSFFTGLVCFLLSDVILENVQSYERSMARCWASHLIVYWVTWHSLKLFFYKRWPTTFLLSKSESVKFSLIESGKFSLIESVICLFTDSSVRKYFSLSNQSIFTEIISEIWLIYSNLFLAIWISEISSIISRSWLIQIKRVRTSHIFHKNAF